VREIDRCFLFCCDAFVSRELFAVIKRDGVLPFLKRLQQARYYKWIPKKRTDDHALEPALKEMQAQRSTTTDVPACIPTETKF